MNITKNVTTDPLHVPDRSDVAAVVQTYDNPNTADDACVSDGNDYRPQPTQTKPIPPKRDDRQQ